MFPWAQAKLFQLRHFLHPTSCKFRTFYDLTSAKKIAAHMLYSYIQVEHFLLSKQHSLPLQRPTDFEQICCQGLAQVKLITIIYKLLHNFTQASGIPTCLYEKVVDCPPLSHIPSTNVTQSGQPLLNPRSISFIRKLITGS